MQSILSKDDYVITQFLFQSIMSVNIKVKVPPDFVYLYKRALVNCLLNHLYRNYIVHHLISACQIYLNYLLSVHYDVHCKTQFKRIYS